MAQSINLDTIVRMGEEKGFEVEHDVDYGAGPINVVWNINIHPALPDIKCGFVVIEDEEGGNQDTEDNQLSLRKIEEAAFRGIRSGLDKVYIVAENEEMAKSVSGKIEWLASHGSLLRLDATSLGLYPGQQESSVLTPSQQRVPEGERIRKEAEREREEKFDKYNRPQGERRDKESEEERREREVKFDGNSRPKGQKKVSED